MRRRFAHSGFALWASAWLVPSVAAADPFPVPFQSACAAARERVADDGLARKIAAAERLIEERRQNAWVKIADLAQYACTVGARTALETTAKRCAVECATDRDRYLALVICGQTLERFGDPIGAETQYLRAIGSQADATNGFTAYYSYALLLDRSGRPRDAFDLLQRWPGPSSAFGPLRDWIMRELGMQVAVVPPATDRVPAALLEAPLSAIPVEDNPRAQSPLAQRIEVAADVWVEPRAGVLAEQPGHLYYHRASFGNPNAFQKQLQIRKGETFLVVASLGDTGCRILVGSTRYDVLSCPWRSGTGPDAALFRAVDTVRSPPAMLPSPVPPTVATASAAAPEWSAWEALYRAPIGVEQIAEMPPQEAAAVKGAGQEYLRQLARIDEAFRAELAARFANDPPAATDSLVGLSRADGTPFVLRVPSGTSFSEVLANEGFTARLNERKQALLRAHLDDLARAIGPESLARLKSVVAQRALSQRTVTGP